MEAHKPSKTHSKTGITSFEHIELGVQGVFGRPYVDMGGYLDTSGFDQLHMEIILGLALSKNLTHSYFAGVIPPEVREQFFQQPLESEVMTDIEKFDPTGFHWERMKEMDTQQRRRYCHFAFGTIPPWHGTLSLISSSFFDKTSSEKTIISEDAKHFPMLMSYIDGLRGNVFDQIGRAMFFISYPNCEVPVHRDWVQEKHKDHCINFFFDAPRPAFIYDEKKKEKIYLSTKTRAYFFNNRDYHGVDAESRFRYTLRVDGTFSEKIQKDLGLLEGYVC